MVLRRSFTSCELLFFWGTLCGMTEASKDIDPGALAEGEVLSSMEPSGLRADHDKALIGSEMRFWRKERSLTGAKLAKLSEITPGMLTKIEQGKVAPCIQTLLSISNALNLPIPMFFHRIECRCARTLGTLPVNSLIWGGGSFHDGRRTGHPT